MLIESAQPERVTELLGSRYRLVENVYRANYLYEVVDPV